MKKNTNKVIISIVFILAMLIWSTLPLWGINIVIPGDEGRICYHVNFFYNFPSEDFLYYLNDLLLFSESPDGMIITKGFRDRLIQTLNKHYTIKSYMRKLTGDEKYNVSFNMFKTDDIQKASDLLSLMGRKLKKNTKGLYCLESFDPDGLPDYFQFSLLQAETLETQINKTNYFTFHLLESEVPLPAEWDMKFFREVSGLPLNPSNFFENILKDKRLSLLLGVLYRMSDNETRYISNLGREANLGEYGAWKKIYNDRKLLMGMFVLSPE